VTDRYQPTPAIPAQANCPHRIQNKAGSECETCGSRKTAQGKWEFLTATWVAYYIDAAPRPEPFNLKETNKCVPAPSPASKT
jgi:hypothetical protein